MSVVCFPLNNRIRSVYNVLKKCALCHSLPVFVRLMKQQTNGCIRQMTPAPGPPLLSSLSVSNGSGRAARNRGIYFCFTGNPDQNSYWILVVHFSAKYEKWGRGQRGDRLPPAPRLDCQTCVLTRCEHTVLHSRATDGSQMRSMKDHENIRNQTNTA